MRSLGPAVGQGLIATVQVLLQLDQAPAGDDQMSDEEQ